MASKATSPLPSLRARFRRGGYIRTYDPSRRKSEGTDAYKKGFEVRFVVATQAEITEIRELLEAAGLRPGKTFKKASKIVQPVYGAEAVRLITGEDPRPER